MRIAWISMLALGLALRLPAAGAAPPRCDLHLRSTPGTGGSCLDLAAPGSNALMAGGNVTRIAREGLRFCPGAFQVTTGGAADVVFLVDNSGSMWSTRAYAKAGDTAFLDDGQCGIGTTGGALTYPVWDDKASPRPPSKTRTVGVLSSDPGGGCELAGDPYNTRAYIVRKAIDFLAANAPASAVGVLGFAAATMNGQALLGLSDPANVEKLKAKMVPDSAFGTNYGVALDSARGWLSDSALSRNAKKAIVLISDGRPGYGFDLSRDSTHYPVFGIYLGKRSTPDTAILKGLADRTGGSFFRVDPTRSGTLQAVMDTIIKKITATAIPKALTLTNGSLTAPQTSTAGGFALDPQGRVTASLDSILALAPGRNDLRVRATMADGAEKSFDLIVQADGPALAASSGDFECMPQASLELVDARGAAPALYPASQATLTARLARSPGDTAAQVVRVATRAPGKPADAESVALAAAGSADPLAAYQGALALDGRGTAPAANGTAEAFPGGELELSWRHPRDARESATLVLKGEEKPPTLPPTADPPGRTFTTLDPDVSVTLAPGEPDAIIHFTVDGSEPAETSPVYAGPLTIAATTVLKAMDIAPGKAASSAAVFRYTRVQAPKVATPFADPPGKGRAFYAFPAAPQAIAFGDDTPGAAIWYSFAGSAPAAATGFQVRDGGELRLWAIKAGMVPSDTAVVRLEYDGPSRVYVRFPNGSDVPGKAGPAAPPAQPYLFIPVDKDGAALPGTGDGKCGPACVPGGPGPENPFAGPIFNLEIPGPCRYAFRIYTSHGEWVADGEGAFTAGDLAHLASAPGGAGRLARVVWTGRTSHGNLAATGAYVLRWTIWNQGTGAGSSPVSVRSSLVRFGLVRSP